ncbi:AMP-binding protein [Gordonia sp. PP30]|nr:AMP-binding protein [Gordonia sp. PP30]
MTETVAAVTVNPPGAGDPGAIGLPFGGRSTAVVDPATAVPVPDDAPGILLVRGRRGVDLFAGYVDDPALTADAFATAPVGVDCPPDPDGEEWFRTGDLVRRTAYGQLVFVGRVDDVIKVAGENVSLAEIESAVAEAPGVLESRR